MSLLTVESLNKSFGGVRAVDDVSFELPKGHMMALLGPNGAGKSTCFNMLNGQLVPSSGSIRMEGKELIGKRPRDIWRLGVGRTFQIAAVFNSMSVLENVQMALFSHQRRLLRFFKPLHGYDREPALELLRLVGIEQYADKPCSTLAYGDVKRVELAIAMAHGPRLLLMDEPCAGMAPHERNGLMALTRRLVDEQGISVLFTEHSMDVVFSFADSMLVLARGKLIAAGDGDHIRHHPKVKEVYFGSGKTFEEDAHEPNTGAPVSTEH